MSIYIIRRLFLLVFVLTLLSIFSFSLGYLFPGDPLTNFTGQQDIPYYSVPELRQAYYLDSNIATQYIAYLTRILQGDFGISFSSGASVFEEIKRVFPATIELACYALLVSLFVGIILGSIAAMKNNSPIAKLINYIALVGQSLPIFWWALILIMFFSFQLGLFPISGRLSLLYPIQHQTGFLFVDIYLSDASYRTAALKDALRHIILPTAVLSMYPTTVMLRFTRESLLNVLDTPYIKTAKAKGMSQTQLMFRHGLRNSLLPVIKQIGLQFSTLLTMAMLTEFIFSWPGIGRWLVEAIYQRDYTAIQGGLLIVGCFIIIITVLIEIVHMILNPLARKDLYASR
ncbi:ABC transporter permease [Algicola sagamiensis]|uniref:ABC transporter permease n=1 Tax=Algicola sagamiensis TaxID=163869 RepID=UPI000375C381|nr:ABC transporter permease subunit [Algicola sagamiensis]